MQFANNEGRIVSPALSHQGTFNANPVSAAAGIATLEIVRSTGIIDCANRNAAALRDAMNDRLRRRGSCWCVYGDFSGFHLFTNPGRENIGPNDIQAGRVLWKAREDGESRAPGAQNSYRAPVRRRGFRPVAGRMGIGRA